MGTKVIFLDIDGVLNDNYTTELIPDTHITGIDNKYVKKLKKIVRETGAIIVLSSTWRKEITRFSDDVVVKGLGDYLRKKLAKQGLHYVSSTPSLGGSRGEEIKKWLEDNNDIHVESYVILDDVRYKEYYEGSLADHFVWTITNVEGRLEEGLTDFHVEKAIKILNGEKIYAEDED